MKTPGDAAALAEACTALAAAWGRPTRAAVTDMSQPLGDAIGNALDVVEAVALLRGEIHGRLRDAAVIFAGEALSRLSGQAMGEARARAASALDSGEALEAFRRMVEAQGGDPHVVDDPEGVLPASPVRTVIASDRSGTLAALDAEALGRASGDLGAGRRRKGDPIDPAVGVVFHPKIGDRVERGQELGNVHARTDEDAERCVVAIRGALTIGEDPSTRRRSSTAGTDDRPEPSVRRLPRGVARRGGRGARVRARVRRHEARRPEPQAMGPAHAEPQATDRPVRHRHPAGARPDPRRHQGRPLVAGVRLREADAARPVGAAEPET